MTFDPYKLIKYHLYLLQLENYQLGRFWKLLFKKGWFPPVEHRKELVWTAKAKTLFVISEILILFVAALLYNLGFYAPYGFVWQKFLGFLAKVYILSFFTPVFLTLAVIILWPIDWFVKQGLVFRAKAKIKSFPDLKVIGVAGSYGKTTMKQVLAAVLSLHYKVEATPESVNTPVGIARWILKKVNSSAEVVIIEMGEHYRGDVKDVCGIARPDIVVITGINESHLERMGTLENVIGTVFEAVGAAKPGAAIILNGDDKNVMDNYKNFVWPDHRIADYKMENAKYEAFNPQTLYWEAEFKGVGKININLVGEYALGSVGAAIKIAELLGLNNEQIKKGILNIKPVEHRLQPIRSAGDILVIDDSYNGNPAGAEEAVKALSRFTDRRKLFITPGLVEMGKATEAVHRKIGLQLATVANVVILIKNSVTPFIELGIKEYKPNSPEVIWFDSAQEAHAALGKILKPGDVIVFQNDWGDQYV